MSGSRREEKRLIDTLTVLINHQFTIFFTEGVELRLGEEQRLRQVRAAHVGVAQIGAGSEREIDDSIRRESGFDPDLWVIEIESRDGRTLLDEPGLA